MPWCPKCKNEYVQGIKTCSECKCELVETLEDIASMEEAESVRPLVVGEEKALQALVDLLQENDIQSAELKYNEEDEVYEVYVDKSEQLTATKVANAYAYQMSNKIRQERIKEEPPEEYVSAASKSEDAKSSGIVLIGVGVVGIAALVLFLTGVIPVHLSTLSKILTGTLMGGFFSVLFVMGIVSLKKNKSLQSSISEENEQEERLKKYIEENITAKMIDEKIQEQSSEAMAEMDVQKLYFMRTELIRKMITENLSDLKDGMIDNYIEEYYDTLFADEEK